MSTSDVHKPGRPVLSRPRADKKSKMSSNKEKKTSTTPKGQKKSNGPQQTAVSEGKKTNAGPGGTKPKEKDAEKIARLEKENEQLKVQNALIKKDYNFEEAKKSLKITDDYMKQQLTEQNMDLNRRIEKLESELKENSSRSDDIPAKEEVPEAERRKNEAKADAKHSSAKRPENESLKPQPKDANTKPAKQDESLNNTKSTENQNPDKTDNGNKGAIPDEKQLLAARSEIDALRNQLKETEIQRSEFDKTKSELASSQSKIDKLTTELENSRKETSKLNETNSDLESKLKKSETELENVKKQLSEIEKLRNKLSSKQSEINKLNTELEDANNKIAKQIEDTETAKNEVNHQTDNTKNKNKGKEIKDELASKLNETETELEKIIVELTTRNNELQNKDSVIARKDEELKKTEAEVKKHKNKIENMDEEIQRKKSEIDELHNKINGYEKKPEKGKMDSTVNPNGSVAKYRKELQEAKDEIEDLKNRLSKVIGAKITDGNPDIADLSDMNRPTKLAEKYAELYDNEWTDAYEEIETKKKMEEKKVIETLLSNLKDVYEFCRNESKDYEANIKKSALAVPGTKGERPKTPNLSATSRKLFVDLRKTFAPLLIDDVFKKYKKKNEKNLHGYTKTTEYIKTCVEICWLMSVQDPPVVLDIKDPKGPFDGDKYRTYTRSGKTFDFIVWPPMCLKESGPLLGKGVAQAK